MMKIVFPWTHSARKVTGGYEDLLTQGVDHLSEVTNQLNDLVTEMRKAKVGDRRLKPR